MKVSISLRENFKFKAGVRQADWLSSGSAQGGKLIRKSSQIYFMTMIFQYYSENMYPQSTLNNRDETLPRVKRLWTMVGWMSTTMASINAYDVVALTIGKRRYKYRLSLF